MKRRCTISWPLRGRLRSPARKQVLRQLLRDGRAADDLRLGAGAGCGGRLAPGAARRALSLLGLGLGPLVLLPGLLERVPVDAAVVGERRRPRRRSRPASGGRRCARRAPTPAASQAIWRFLLGEHGDPHGFGALEGGGLRLDHRHQRDARRGRTAAAPSPTSTRQRNQAPELSHAAFSRRPWRAVRPAPARCRRAQRRATREGLAGLLDQHAQAVAPGTRRCCAAQSRKPRSGRAVHHVEGQGAGREHRRLRTGQPRRPDWLDALALITHVEACRRRCVEVRRFEARAVLAAASAAWRSHQRHAPWPALRLASDHAPGAGRQQRAERARRDAPPAPISSTSLTRRAARAALRSMSAHQADAVGVVGRSQPVDAVEADSMLAAPASCARGSCVRSPIAKASNLNGTVMLQPSRPPAAKAGIDAWAKPSSGHSSRS